jgi:hypothetical protein
VKLRALAAVSAAFAAGCSLIFSLDPYDPRARTSDETDGASPDATAGDARAGDATPNAGDATSDVVADGPGAGPFACPTGALLCDDFERAQVAGGPWQHVDTNAKISTAQANSPTRSFFADTTQTGTAKAHVNRTFTPAPMRVGLSFQLFVPASPGASDSYEIAKMPFGATNDWDTFTLVLERTRLVAGGQHYDGGVVTGSQSSTAASSEELYGTGWHRITMDVDVSGVTQKTMRLSIDGTPREDIVLASARPSPSPLAVMLGVTFRTTTAAFAGVYMDDVSLVVP